MQISLTSTTMFPFRPKMPLGYAVYMCNENSLAKWRLGLEGVGGGGILKIKLNYTIFSI